MNIYDVAERAKVSVASVSRYINQPVKVRPQTAARIGKAMQELDYRPNENARALAMVRNQFSGIIVSESDNSGFDEIIRNFEEIAVRKGFELQVNSHNPDHEIHVDHHSVITLKLVKQ